MTCPKHFTGKRQAVIQTLGVSAYQIQSKNRSTGSLLAGAGLVPCEDRPFGCSIPSALSISETDSSVETRSSAHHHLLCRMRFTLLRLTFKALANWCYFPLNLSLCMDRPKVCSFRRSPVVCLCSHSYSEDLACSPFSKGHLKSHILLLPLLQQKASTWSSEFLGAMRHHCVAISLETR